MLRARKRVRRQNREFFPADHQETAGRAAKAYLKPKDVSLGESEIILTNLNSIDSPEKLKNTFQKKDGKHLLSTKYLDRIFNARLRLGDFHDLKQIAFVRGIGPKKFDFIVRTMKK